MQNANARAISCPGGLLWAPQGCQHLPPALDGNFGKHKPRIPMVRPWDGRGQGFCFLYTDLTLWSTLTAPLPSGSFQRLEGV